MQPRGCISTICSHAAACQWAVMWQARPVDLPQPDPDLPHLADVVPSVLFAMGVKGFDGPIPLPCDVAGACVLLIDGLGAELLDAYAADAPVLAGLRGRTLQVGFPSTTVAGSPRWAPAAAPASTAWSGIRFRLPGAGVINALRWRPHPWGDDLREAVPPEQVQPMPTTFERAASAGIAVSVISGAEFTGSGLTRAVLRGGRYIGVQALGDLAARVRAAVADRRVLLRLSQRAGSTGASVRPRLAGVAHAVAPGRPAGGVHRGRPAAGRPARRGGRSRDGRRRGPATPWTSTSARPCCDGVARDRRRGREPGTSTSTPAPPTRCWRRGGKRSPTGRGWCPARRRSPPVGSASGSATRSGTRIGDVVAAAREVGRHGAAHGGAVGVIADRPSRVADQRRAASAAAAGLGLNKRHAGSRGGQLNHCDPVSFA